MGGYVRSVAGILRNFFSQLLKRRGMVLLFLLAVSLRLLLFVLNVDQIGTEKFLSTTPDTINYVSMAQGLMDGAITAVSNGFIRKVPEMLL